MYVYKINDSTAIYVKWRNVVLWIQSPKGLWKTQQPFLVRQEVPCRLCGTSNPPKFTSQFEFWENGESKVVNQSWSRLWKNFMPSFVSG